MSFENSVDLDLLKGKHILCDDNQLDAIFLLAVKAQTKVRMLSSQSGNVSTTTSIGDLLQAAISDLLEELDFDEEHILSYVNTIFLLMKRQSPDHDPLGFTMTSKGHHMSPYG